MNSVGLATGSIDYAMDEVARVRHISPTRVDDALFHLRRAREALGDPTSDEWMQDTQEVMKWVFAMIPFLLLVKDQKVSNSHITHLRSAP
jgi:hypothetical protein